MGDAGAWYLYLGAFADTILSLKPKKVLKPNQFYITMTNTIGSIPHSTAYPLLPSLCNPLRVLS